MDSSFRSAMWILSIIMLLVSTSTAYPSPVQRPAAAVISEPEFNATEHDIVPRSIAGGVTLRILPLGASIMYGYLSTDGNGCRWGLRGALRSGGNKVNMVGSVPSGSMADNDVEGWPGFRVDQLYDKAALSTPSQPNVVILQAGTNDVNQNYDIPNTHVRMAQLVNQIFDAVPGVTIVLGTLFPNVNAATDANNKLVSQSYATMVTEMQATGKKISLVDFYNGYFSPSDLRSDNTHPTDAGYLKMAAAFYKGILAVESTITPPNVVAGVDDDLALDGTTVVTKCLPSANEMTGPTQIQRGSGTNDGNYVHTATMHSQTVNHGPAGGALEGVRWADLNGDGQDDFIWVSDSFTYGVALNTGPGTFGAYGTYTPNIPCPKAGVRFGDINADGRSDMLCINADGSMSAWLNTPGSDPRFPSFQPLGTVMQTQADPLAQVRLADIDGDGRIDYVVIRNNGDIVAWRNGGNGDTIAYWQALGTIFPAGTITDTAGIDFVDLNGDGKSDLVYVNANAQVTTWTNQRGFGTGALVPAWLSSGITHGGQTTPSRSKLSWARIWGSQMYDYIISTDAATSVSWQNTGKGGTTIKGDGNHYCDMIGDGLDDYINIAANGEITFFENINNPPLWGTSYGVIFTASVPRQEVHFADMDGDGKCDIVYVDKKTGSFQTIHNNGIVNGAFSFSAPVAGPSNVVCTEGYGLGLSDLGVRFADLDGDGKADYLCIQKNTYTTGFLNTGSNTFSSLGQVKLSIDLDRANIRYVDVTGDGLADLVWIDKFSGAASVWVNAGKIPASGSAFTWTESGSLFPARTARGQNVYFADLKGSGRKDYLVIQPDTNVAWAWYNGCAQSGSAGTSVPAPTLPADPY